MLVMDTITEGTKVPRCSLQLVNLKQIIAASLFKWDDGGKGRKIKKKIP